MEDRRTYRRWGLEGRVVLTAESPSPQVIKGELRDVSFSGVGVIALDTLPVGTQVQVRIITDDGRMDTETPMGKGEIVGLSPAHGPGSPQRIGIRLLDADEKKIDELLLRLQMQRLMKTNRGRQPTTRGWG